ncbi:MAG: hypothetical protein NTY01_18525 [Verrucomicrobia bacterium]|nr:hypothetical protein [Verrucomicrobiota bacterium]
MKSIVSFWLAAALPCFAETAMVEPAARVTLTAEVTQAGRCELPVNEEDLIASLAGVLPDPITRDHFNHADAVLMRGGRRVGGYEFVVAATNLVKDGRFEAPRETSPWSGLRRAEYSFKAEPGQPGQAFWAECAKLQNIRITQPLRLEKGRFYLLSYAAYSDVQNGDVSVQLADPNKTLFATLAHTHRRPVHRQRQWDRRQLIFRADIEQPELRIGAALMGRAAVADVSLRPARWRLVADLPRAGRHELALNYVPRMGCHLTPPPAELKPDTALLAAAVKIGEAVALESNPNGVRIRTPCGEAWTLPSDWPLRVDRLVSSRPAKPAARHEVTVARGMDATVLLALDFGGGSSTLESLHCSLPLHVSALRLASVPISTPGSFDQFIYRQLDPMVPVNDSLVPFERGQPTVLALTIQCAEATPTGVHDGEIELKLIAGSGDIPVAASGQNKTATGTSPLPVKLPVRVRVLPVTVDAVKHFSCVFGNQHLISAPRRSLPTFTEDAVAVATFHGYDTRKRYAKPADNPLLKLARDYVQRMMDFHVEPHAAALMAAINYKVENVPDGVLRLTDWDFTEYDRSMGMFKRRGGRFIAVMHTNGEVISRLSLSNNHTYSFKPAPAGTPRWHQLAEDDYWRMVGGYLETIAAHLADKGWLDGASVLIDESAAENYRTIRRFAEAVRAVPHARRLRLIHSSNHASAAYAMRVSGRAEGPLMLEGALDVFMPENNDHFNDWPEDDIWPADRGPRPRHWVYFVETDLLDLPHAGVSTELLPLKCRWLGAEGMYIWGSFLWSLPYARREGTPLGGGAWGPVMNPWINPNYHHGQGLLAFFYPPDPRGPAKEPTPKLTPSYRLVLLRDGLQDNALWRIVQASVDDAGKPVRVPETVHRTLQSQLDATFINPVQWRVSRPHHQAWRDALYGSLGTNP